MSYKYNGNNILIVDRDEVFSQNLCEALILKGARCSYVSTKFEAIAILQKFEFDLVLCSYQLIDGFIHQLIDWCEDNSTVFPLFASLGFALPDEIRMSQRQSISEVFLLKDIDNIVSGVNRLLFSCKDFENAVFDTFNSSEITLEVRCGENLIHGKPLEITSTGILVSFDENPGEDSYGLLKITFKDNLSNDTFIVPGFFQRKSNDGQVFIVDQKYLNRWNLFLIRLREKQKCISTFLNKASGY